MISGFLRGACFAAAILTAGSAWAQESSNRVAADTDWSVFVEDDPKECWGVSAPKETRIVDSNGNPTTGRRGDILLFVFYRPNAGVDGQVTFTGGYPFAGGSTVTLQIGDSSYELFTEGEWAWPATPEDDTRIIAAMKRGATATLRGRSGRGNQTIDQFSLLGFTAAVEEAARRCA
ncbi:invasion associated locus B family protein [Oceanicola granulosus]|uniref:invasion associated locus B family protein n=1 Tax=Oceanicola granulosus TaxID=252302 RepID=UPI00058C2B06|nr:invasion associated locus B family protein [Oceanicola granulosus]